MKRSRELMEFSRDSESKNTKYSGYFHVGGGQSSRASQGLRMAQTLLVGRNGMLQLCLPNDMLAISDKPFYQESEEEVCSATSGIKSYCR
ncbi:hypothetical protein NDN08_001360 [Rhodosorus marinus]|uniref:Uncharacterized protein n=1 Tax=Rhodosorus marinus TaxID=101924 RepID=A0AAV8UTL8_9RHOD|nr:hypothetical protein NDN08_001360 [Rhodosorus marinus]